MKPFNKTPAPKAAIYFFWKKPNDHKGRLRKEIVGTIYAKVLCNGTSASFSTGFNIQRGEFKNGTVYPESKETQAIRSELRNLKRSLSEVKLEVWHNAKIVWKILCGSYKEGMHEETLLNALNYGLTQTCKNVTKTSELSYVSVINSFENWVIKKLGFKDVALSRLNVKFAISYVDHLQEVGVMQSTVTHQLNILSRFYELYAMDHPENVCPANPFRIGGKRLNSSYKEQNQRRRRSILENCLSESQIKDIMEFDFYGNRKFSMNKWRQVILFQIFTGFAFDDLGSEDWRIITVGDSEHKMIELYRGKTKNRCIVPLLPQTEVVINKLKEMSTYMPKPSLFPFPPFIKDGVTDLAARNMAYAKYSRFLNLFSKMIGFDLRSHLFRHTFGMMMSRKGISMESIAAMMGHSTTTTTMRFYVQPEDETIMNEINAKF
jgi:site-specific recombinase XerD